MTIYDHVYGHTWSRSTTCTLCCFTMALRQVHPPTICSCQIRNTCTNSLAIYGPYMAIYGHIYGHICPYMAIYGHIWPYIWPYMTIYGHLCSTYGHVWPIFGHTWTIYDHIWSVYGHIWSMYSHIWIIYGPYMVIYGPYMSIYGQDHYVNVEIVTESGERSTTSIAIQ